MPLFAAMLLSFALLSLGACATPSATSDGGARVERNLVYATRGDGDVLTADLFRPAALAQGPRPAVIVVHGGGWRRGDRDEMRHIVDALLAQDYVVLNIGYRLAPQHPYPAAVDDVRDAIRWLGTVADRYGIDRERIALWGYSAGAHLAALVAANPDPDLPIAAAVLGGIPADLVRAQNSDLVQQFLGGTIEQWPQRYVEASPLHQLHAGSAPMLLYHGSWDLIVWPEHSRRMIERLQALGVDAEFVALPARGHIAAFFLDGAARDAARDFLARHFAAP